ncbi:hypothetical protein GCM10007927_09270 [Sulfitobacter pacificus]|uniref:Terminase n=2 Tax=Sulfitobacter pacificus TaxID=1499314 RepID=A0ABQ5VGB8_9RHOB|nr:hypothetical protein GCM10007927_09270 [Sulfitobacter pacificus]
MARGRKPQVDVVVPMAEEGFAGHNHEERAKERLAELRPEGMPDQLRWTFDRLALPLCHPTVNRLSATNVFMFVQLCKAVMRHERIELELEELSETYVSETRSGTQIKSRPEVAQLNETFRQIRGLAGEFGMTPSTERGLSNSGQLPFDFPSETGPESYMT